MGNESYAQIGKRVKSYRNQRGFSQEELAAGICSSSTISLLETGQHVPSAEILSKIADKLVIPLREILTEQEHDLDLQLQVDIVKVYVESKSYDNALQLIAELERQDDIREHQRRELILLRAESLLHTGAKEAALEHLKSLQQSLEQQRETDDHFVAAVYNKLGTAYYTMANFTDAHAAYSRAYQLSLRFPQRDELFHKIAFNIGMVCRQLNRFPEATGHLMTAELFFKTNADLHSLAATYFEFGLVYQASQDYKLAGEYLRESLTLYRAVKMMDMVMLVRRTHASVVLAQTEPIKAVEELMQCAGEFERVGDFVRCSYAYAHLAHVLLSMKQVEEARKYLRLAFRELSEQQAKKDPRLAYVFHVQALFLLEIGDIGNCIGYSQKSANFFEEMGLMRNAADSLLLTANALRKRGDLEQAIVVMEQITDILISLHHQTPIDMEVL